MYFSKFYSETHDHFTGYDVIHKNMFAFVQAEGFKLLRDPEVECMIDPRVSNC